MKDLVALEGTTFRNAVFELTTPQATSRPAWRRKPLTLKVRLRVVLLGDTIKRLDVLTRDRLQVLRQTWQHSRIACRSRCYWLQTAHVYLSLIVTANSRDLLKLIRALQAVRIDSSFGSLWRADMRVHADLKRAQAIKHGCRFRRHRRVLHLDVLTALLLKLQLLAQDG